jgi:hypothetical protein
MKIDFSDGLVSPTITHVTVNVVTAEYEIQGALAYNMALRHPSLHGPCNLPVTFNNGGIDKSLF